MDGNKLCLGVNFGNTGKGRFHTAFTAAYYLFGFADAVLCAGLRNFLYALHFGYNDDLIYKL